MLTGIPAAAASVPDDFRTRPNTRSYEKPGWLASALHKAVRKVCEAATSLCSSCNKRKQILDVKQFSLSQGSSSNKRGREAF